MKPLNWIPAFAGMTVCAGVAVLLAGCTVGPDYKRPEADLPKDYGVAQSSAAIPERWWSVFADPVLDRLIDEALTNNRDLRVAAARIEQARAGVAIARADMFPSAGIEAQRSRTRLSKETGNFFEGIPVQSDDNRLVARVSWELDFWGKYRRATEAARADLAAGEAGRDAVRLTLIGDVVRGYFALRALDSRVEETLRTRDAWAQSVKLETTRFERGAISELEVRQTESQLRAAEASLPVLRQAIVRQEGALAVLLGRSPRAVFAAAIDRGSPAMPTVEVPAGLPSDLLLRRPDIRVAEERLHAANARIGVARAAYFPSITLTGFFGGESEALRDIFSPSARTWNVAAGLLQPLWAGGAIRGGVDLADTRTREAAELYQQALAVAFRDVRDAIQAQTNARDALTALRSRETALTRTRELARLRYDNGAVSLIEALDAERQLILARLEAIDAERARREAIVDLYLALGG